MLVPIKHSLRLLWWPSFLWTTNTAAWLMKSSSWRGNSSFPVLRTQAQTSEVCTWRSVLCRMCLYTGHIWWFKKKKIGRLLEDHQDYSTATSGIWTTHLSASLPEPEIPSHWVWSRLSGSLAAGVTGAPRGTLWVWWRWIQSREDPPTRDPPPLMGWCCGWESGAWLRTEWGGAVWGQRAFHCILVLFIYFWLFVRARL